MTLGAARCAGCGPSRSRFCCVAAAIFVATLNKDGGWAYVHATAEAAMVGAIADWFAVTALFRHPLGLPIPHTAIIPSRKDSLARSLQEFVTDNFLSEEVVRTRVADARVSERVGAWIARARAQRAGRRRGVRRGPHRAQPAQ